MGTALNELASRFDQIAIPSHGRYVLKPTTNSRTNLWRADRTLN
jgi:hypothetical protein